MSLRSEIRPTKKCVLILFRKTKGRLRKRLAVGIVAYVDIRAHKNVTNFCCVVEFQRVNSDNLIYEPIAALAILFIAENNEPC